MSLESYIQQAEEMELLEKLDFVSDLLELEKVSEIEAYRILTAHGEPKPQLAQEKLIGCVDFLDD
ncbi:TPA: hypothetical protein RSV74_002530 [Mannheimia haemolytica]|nr:hypothetical protein [Mannheimia haemolytica]